MTPALRAALRELSEAKRQYDIVMEPDPRAYAEAFAGVVSFRSVQRAALEKLKAASDAVRVAYGEQVEEEERAPDAGCCFCAGSGTARDRGDPSVGVDASDVTCPCLEER